MRFKTMIIVFCFGLIFFSPNFLVSVLAQPSSTSCLTCPGSQSSLAPVIGQYAEDPRYQEVFSLYRGADQDWQAKKWDQAVNKYSSVTRRAPSTPLAALSHMKLGLYLKYYNRWDDAINEFQKGIAIIPGTREAHDAKTSVACVYAFRGNYDQALGLLNEVLTETKDWDQVKYCNYWIKKIERLKASGGRLSWCGPKALAFIFKVKGRNVPEDELIKLFSASTSQTSMEEIKRAAVSKGLKAQGVRARIDQLDGMEFPVIALVLPGHYVVILSSDEKGYKMIDPEKGERTVKIYKEELEKDWTGYVLTFSEKDILANSSFPVLTHAEMESMQGGACSCCPTGGLGGLEDNPNQVYDVIEGPVKGCVTKKGMPRILVSTVDFNLVVEDTDLSYSGLGPTVEIKRTYNANDSRESVFGRSWTFNYNVSLYEAPPSAIYVYRGSGKVDLFGGSGGTYHAAKTYDVLTKHADGTYTLWIKKDKTNQNFDVNGKLTSIVDRNNNAVTFQNETINPPLIWGTQGNGDGQFNQPYGLATDPLGNVYVADTVNHRIQKFDSNGNFIAKWGTNGSGDGQFSFPYCVAVDQAGYVYVADTGNNRIQKFDSNGSFITKWGSPGNGNGQFASPWGIATDRDQSGNIYVYVTEYTNNRIQKFDGNGNFITKWNCWNTCTGLDVLSFPEGVAVDPSTHNVYVSNTNYNRIVKFDSNGNYISQWGSFDSQTWRPGPGEFYFPVQLAVDPSGYVYVADSYNARVQKFDGNGNYITQWGSPNEYYGEFAFSRPLGVAVDQSGHLYVADTLNYRIKKLLSDLPSGIFLTSITDAAGRITSFTYWTDSYKVHTITDPAGRQASFTYENGNLKTATDMAGSTTTYNYDTHSYMTSITTPSGTTTIQGASQISTITDPLNNVRRYYYVPYTYDTEIFDARNNPTYYRYDTTSYCGTLSVWDALGNTTSFGYDGNCNRTSIRNANGHTTTIGYNAYGDITFIKDPVCADLGCQTTFNYWNDRDYLKEIIDPRNNKYSFDYDANWNLRHITDPLNRITEFRYNPSGNGQLTEFIDARSNSITFTYDPDGNIETVTGPLIGSPSYSLVTTFGYDDVSRLTSITDPRGNVTSHEYDGIDRLKKITYPDTKTVEYTYFCCGQNTVKDENGKVTTYQPDADNRLWRAFDPEGGMTEFQYDVNGNLRYLTDPKNQTTEFIYFAQVDRLQKIKYPEGDPAEEFDYYPAGNLKLKKSRKLEQTDYVYNKNVRVTSISGPGVSIGYGYDNAGNLNSMTDSIGSTTFESDELNRLRYVIYPGGKRIDYTYDEAGNLHTIATSFGLVSYDYDAYNRLSRITLPNLNVIDYHYDENNYKGNLTSIHYSNGTYTTFDYDNRNRMTGLTNNGPGGIISQYAYTLDGVGNRTNVSFQEPLSWTPSMVGVDYSYLPGNFLTAAGSTNYSYDPNGNLYTRTQGGNTTTYTFDSQDRLTGISSPSLNFQYQYDGLFNRVSKTDTGTATKYLVDPNGFLPQVIAEMDGSYNITSYYVYDGIGLVAKMIPSGSTYFYHYNGSGNTIAMTDSSGNMVNKYAYDEFGNLMNAVETVPNPFLFVGQYGVMDDDSGLLYMNARYYDPQVGRFINKDPVGYWGGVNLFTYAGNNPLSWIDPLGLRIVVIGNMRNYQQAVAYLSRDPGMAAIINELNGSSTTYTVILNSIGNDSYVPATQTINWDPNSALRCTSGGRQSPALGLGHEMAHADAPWYWKLIGWVPWPAYDNLEERRVIVGPETAAAKTFGEGTRKNHGGTPYWVPTPTSR